MKKQDDDELNFDKLPDKDGRAYMSNDVKVTCVHCQHTKFGRSKALLNTRGMSFMDLDWLNESATTLICKRCGYIHWFANDVTEIKA